MHFLELFYIFEVALHLNNLHMWDETKCDTEGEAPQYTDCFLGMDHDLDKHSKFVLFIDTIIPVPLMLDCWKRTLQGVSLTTS